ncbi:unnamed protein product [Lactuca saligna]|uniref:Uncharacterized protein n=1 Tax=Lactuca saligna TaxID=75948 RepID=A0AA35ZLZ4_LACSI|nr:unnamed protein product [Lactuca saligna]
MSLGTTEDDSGTEIHLPCDIDWEMLDKLKFFFLGANLFSGVFGMLYPIMVLKTRKQVLVKYMPCLKLMGRGFYKGFGTSLMEAKAANIVNLAAGLSAAMVAQMVWTPIDVVSLYCEP